MSAQSESKSAKAKASTPSKRSKKATANSAPDPATLSARQKRILEVITDAVLLRGYPPSIREIGDAAGLQSTSSVAYQLKELEKKGFLRRDPNKPRAVDVRHLPQRVRRGAKRPGGATESSDADVRNIPLVGSIAAGSPILAEQNIEDYYSVPTALVTDGDLFLLKVSGDSMQDAGILNGDWIIVRQQPVAEQGDFVAALIEGEATVKEFHKDSTGVWLLPHNDSYSPISGKNAEIMGKVVSVMRRL